MSIVVLGSAKGSPGVTTTAMAIACCLGAAAASGSSGVPPVLVVEADPAGGDIAAREGKPGVPGLATLALRARRSLGASDLAEHCQPLCEGVAVLVGVAGHDQGAAVRPALERIVEVLAGLEGAVIVDVGRFDRLDDFEPVLSVARLVGLVSRTTTEAVLHGRSSAESLRGRGVSPELVLVGEEGHRPRAVARAVELPLLGTVPEDGSPAALPLSAMIDPRSPRGRAYFDLASAVAERLGRPLPAWRVAADAAGAARLAVSPGRRAPSRVGRLLGSRPSTAATTPAVGLP